MHNVKKKHKKKNRKKDKSERRFQHWFLREIVIQYNLFIIRCDFKG